MGDFGNGNKLAGWCRFVVWALTIIIGLAGAFLSVKFQATANERYISLLSETKLDKAVYIIERDNILKDIRYERELMTQRFLELKKSIEKLDSRFERVYITPRYQGEIEKDL